MEFIPLSSWSGDELPLEPALAHLDRIGWLPLGEGELLLAAHYLPLAVRLDGPRPQLGAIVRRDMLARDLVAPPGRWVGGYSPMSLRCFPFRIGARKLTDDPIADLEFAQLKDGVSKPKPLRIRDENGASTAELKVIYENVKGILVGQHRMQPALDTLLAAELLVAIGAPETELHAAGYFTIDRRRFAASSNHALAAMARNSFSTIELATVLNFSQVHLRAEIRPAATPVPTAPGEQAAPPIETGLQSGLETITPWLDTSELFPGAWAADPSIWRAIADPALPAKAGAEP